MRVAIYSGTFKKNQDGVARATYELVNSLLEGHHRILLGAPLITPQHRAGLELVLIPSFPFKFYPDYRFALPYYKFYRKLDEFQPDIIHIATPDLMGLITLVYAKRRNIPVIFIHHTDFQSYMKYFQVDWLVKTMWPAMVAVYNKALNVFAPTQKYVDLLHRKGVKHVDIWSRGIDRKQFNPKNRSKELRKAWNAENKKVFLFVGRLVWYKGLRTFIKIYKQFENRLDKDMAFVLIGDGPIRATLQAEMPKAIFTGYLHGEKLGQAYASADVLLFPSTTETFGQVIQEALASGLPVIVSDKGGCQEIVNQSKGGIIVPWKNLSLWKEACEVMLFDEIQYHKYRESGLKYAESRNWKKLNEQLIQKYQNYAFLWNQKQRFNYPVPIQEKIDFIRCVAEDFSRWSFSRI
ncbi:MAG: glycosyltransferase family 1 protein [Candidatus Lokiarchaeota archaeon]|nr:glycosyltransferase family 1 protein [Candidatus Harpocratesius repetitus]